MNKRPIRLLCATITILLLVSVFSAVTVKTTISSQIEAEPKGIDDNVKDVTVAIDEPLGETGPTHHSYWQVGQSAIWLRYGSGYASQFTYFTLEYIGINVEIWVQNNIRYPTGDPRNGPGNNPGPTRPTTAMCQYYAEQFDNNILPEESEFFGPPLSHDGLNAQVPVYYPTLPGMAPDYYYEPTGRSVILVSNIRDANFFDPNYPYYVIGSFVSSYTDFYFDRNIVNIDAVSWYHALGPAGTVWGPHYYWPDNTFHTHPVTTGSQYAYDSTLAHEWQHLLHHELAPGDDLFMNEGCSMYAEFLCNYGIDPDYPNSYFATPDNSLTEWGDQGDINILADYGAAALWTMYLADRYGAEFIRLYFRLGAPEYGIHGIDGINYALYFTHNNERFPDVYRDWTLANLIRADNPGAGKYNYKSLNLNDPEYIPVRTYEISGLPVPWTRGNDFGNTITILGYDTGVSKVARWGTDFIAFDNWNHPGHIYFDGDDVCVPAPPHLWTLGVDGYWYSGTGEDLADEFIVGNAYVDPTNPTLTIVTKYGLETLWDYGLVQVSTNGGTTWTSLANAYTTTDHDPAAHPDIVANLPGLTDYNPDWPGWTTMSFDLTSWAGQNVMIGFRYMTDWATTYEGWWIQSPPHVGGTELTLTPWVPTPTASFQVTTVSVFIIDGKTQYVPNDMPIASPANTGRAVEYAKKPNYVVLVVTPTMQKGMADYQFKAQALPMHRGGGGYIIAFDDSR
jgi:hypothetical protein